MMSHLLQLHTCCSLASSGRGVNTIKNMTPPTSCLFCSFSLLLAHIHAARVLALILTLSVSLSVRYQCMNPSITLNVCRPNHPAEDLRLGKIVLILECSLQPAAVYFSPFIHLPGWCKWFYMKVNILMFLFLIKSCPSIRTNVFLLTTLPVFHRSCKQLMTWIDCMSRGFAVTSVQWCA